MIVRTLRRRIIASARLMLVALVVLYTLFPFYWAIVSSLKTGPALLDIALLPRHPSLDNYTSVFQEQPFARNILNSFMVALSTVIDRVGPGFDRCLCARARDISRSVVIACGRASGFYVPAGRRAIRVI